MTDHFGTSPQAGEYGAFYAGYVSRVEPGDILDRLTRQGEEIERLFGELDEETLGFRYAPGKWSLREVLGHLSDTERVMAYRALRVARGDTTPLPGFDENTFVAAAGFDRRRAGSLVDEFRTVRAATLSLLRSIGPREWVLRGEASGAPVTPRSLAWIIIGHAEHHLAIVRERYLAGITPPGR